MTFTVVTYRYNLNSSLIMCSNFAVLVVWLRKRKEFAMIARRRNAVNKFYRFHSLWACAGRHIGINLCITGVRISRYWYY